MNDDDKNELALTVESWILARAAELITNPKWTFETTPQKYLDDVRNSSIDYNKWISGVARLTKFSWFLGFLQDDHVETIEKKLRSKDSIFLHGTYFCYLSLGCPGQFSVVCKQWRKMGDRGSTIYALRVRNETVDDVLENVSEILEEYEINAPLTLATSNVFSYRSEGLRMMYLWLWAAKEIRLHKDVKRVIAEKVWLMRFPE